MRAEAAANVDEYLDQVGSDKARETLSRLRTIILDAAPEAKEVISYRIPTYQFHGFVCGFAAFKNHCSFFPGHTVADFSAQLSAYKTSKGTIQFPHDHLMPESLVREIVSARLLDNLAQSKERK